MPRRLFLPLVLTLASVVTGMLSNARSSPPETGSGEHGKYIVENIAMCGQCHSPRTDSGDIIRDQWLKGAPIPVRSPYVYQTWAEYAPRVAGLPQYTDEQAITLLTTGIARTGKELRRPMPPFRMSMQDARDVVAYLRSLE
jgi:mono/diheme cytochrome c family protein